jgi:hypothetical protein
MHTLLDAGSIEEDDMAETKKRGFHALEERIHQMEEEDKKQQRKAGTESEEAPRNMPEQERDQPRRK